MPWYSLFDIKWCCQIPKPPHLARGMRTQQLKAKARKAMTCVYHGVTNKFPIPSILLMFDQSSVRFKNPMPPRPLPMKFATLLFGATQQRKASDESIGKTYSGRNCHKVIPRSTLKNTIVCFLETGDGNSRCLVWVSNSAVWQSL